MTIRSTAVYDEEYLCRRKKAFNVTYDDGVLQDTRFVALPNKNNLKGTFNLNSGLIEREFEWMHESGLSAFTAE